VGRKIKFLIVLGLMSAFFSVCPVKAQVAETPKPTSTPSSFLTPSGKIVITADNQVVQNVKITSTDGDGILCSGHSNIDIHNVAILYNGGNGISLNGCDGAKISNVNILFTGAPPSGPNDSTERNCIQANNSDNLNVSDVLATDCSSGVYTQKSDAPKISFIKCINMRGPYPRGQCVQFNQSNNCSLSDFYSYNDLNVAWTNDNVNIFQSSNCTIQRGVIDGNNRVNGSGIVAEDSSSNVTVSDIDVYHWCNCAFGTSNGTNVVFNRVHASDSYKPCTQGAPASGTGVAFISYDFNPSPPTTGTVFSQAQYFNLASGNQILYDGNPSTVAIKDIKQFNFTKRIPIIPVVPSISVINTPIPSPTDTPKPTPIPSNVPFTSPVSGTISFKGDWSNGLSSDGSPRANSWKYIQQFAANRITRVSDITRRFPYSARFELRPGDVTGPVGEDAQVSLMQDANANEMYENENSDTQYYGISIRLNDPFPATVLNSWMVILELHTPDTSTYAKNPSFLFEPYNDVAHTQKWSVTMHSGDYATSRFVQTYELSNSALALGKWTDFIFKIKWAKDYTGSVDIWRRDEGETGFINVLSVKNIPTLAFNSSVENKAPDHYWRVGPYRNNDTTTAILWNDHSVNDLDYAIWANNYGK
jgi:hypothetical protein